MKWSRQWAMPNKQTFAIRPIRDFIFRYATGLKKEDIIDAFAGWSDIAGISNDLNPNSPAPYHMEASEFLRYISEWEKRRYDLCLFDPPYSPRQISECYKTAGLTTTMIDTQDSRLMSKCKRELRKLIKPGGYVLSFGWNSIGMGKEFEIVEIMLVCHGGAHNDTICMAEKRTCEALELSI